MSGSGEPAGANSRWRALCHSVGVLDLRRRFPAVTEGNYQGWARFDGPAGTQVVDSAIEATAAWQRSGNNANSHGQFAAAGINPRRHLAELRLENEAAAAEYEVGQELTAEIFADGAYVDVTGTSKGKGFAGTMKRHGFKGQGASHGAQAVHRRPGSIGGSAPLVRALTQTAEEPGNRAAKTSG